jgi:hypothetical protein
MLPPSEPSSTPRGQVVNYFSMAIFSGESEGNLAIWSDERVIAVIFLHQNFHKNQMSEGGSEL